MMQKCQICKFFMGSFNFGSWGRKRPGPGKYFAKTKKEAEEDMKKLTVKDKGS